jgi:class III poly(R)-hydroxyalkanoic acid synthase PhaE subunit
MSDKGADTLYWTDVYLKGQEEFLKRWSQFGAAQPGTAGASPFASPFNAQFASPAGWPNWAQLFGAQMPGPAADVTRHYFNLHEQYLTATRSLWDTLAKAAAQPDPAQRVTEFTQGLQQLQGQFTKLWQSMFAQWSGNSATAANAGGATNSPFAMPGMPQSLDMPALGLTRERQEALQQLQQLMGEYLQQQGALSQLWGEVIADGLKRLGETLTAKLQSGDLPKSGKALYDLWVESGEASYAVMAHSPRYAKAQADLGNTLAKLRTQQREVIESVSRELDLPTRAELNTVHRRLKDMKAEIRALRAELDRAKAPRANGARSAKPRTDLAN